MSGSRASRDTPLLSIHVPMRGRDPNQPSRGSTPLELLFDLTFVVAITQLGVEYAKGLADGLGFLAAGSFLFLFIAVWWAWTNFTWFSSAYDTDDALYRLLTIVQMSGVLVLAIGIPGAYENGDYLVMIVGYLIMRFALALQWTRVAVEQPARRATALRYAIGMALAPFAWIGWLFVPPGWAIPVALVLLALDHSVPNWAERAGATAWHPFHIAERYGLFAIILLGEGLLALTSGVREAFAEGNVTPLVIGVAVGGLVIIAAVWWLYFAAPMGEGLEQHRRRAFAWGYGHLPLFAGIAAMAIGIEVAILSIGRGVEAPDLEIALAIALPVSIVLLTIWFLHQPLIGAHGVPGWILLPAGGLTLATPLAVGIIGLAGVVFAIAAVLTAAVGAALAWAAAGRSPWQG